MAYRGSILIASLVLLFTALGTDVQADIRIYLYSSVNLGGDALRVGNVASVDGGSDVAKKIADTEIPGSFYRDGYIDRMELEGLIGGKTRELIYIYGSAVRIRKQPAGKTVKPVTGVRIKSGEPVDVSIKKNGITLTLTGNAASDGMEGQSIKVKLKNSRVVKGVLRHDKSIELTL